MLYGTRGFYFCLCDVFLPLKLTSTTSVVTPAAWEEEACEREEEERDEARNVAAAPTAQTNGDEEHHVLVVEVAVLTVQLLGLWYNVINNANLTIIWSQSFEKSKPIKYLFLYGNFYVLFCS
jgi:hypothetical protein